MFKRHIVGFDVGGRELKVAILRRSGSDVELVGLNSVQIKSKDDAERCEEVGRRLFEILSMHRVRDAAVCACVPMTACTLRRLTLPPVKGRDAIEQLIQMEMQSQIPIPISRVLLSYIVQSRTREGMEVLVALCKREAAEFLLRAAHIAGLQLSMIAPSVLACWHATSEEALQERMTCIVDIGAASTDIVVGYGGTILVARSAPVGVDHLLKGISLELNRPVEEIEGQVCRDGVNISQIEMELEEGSEASPTLDWLLRLEEEISKTAQVVERSFNETIRKVLLCGCALMPNLPEWLSKRLGVDVQPLDMPRIDVRLGSLVSRSEFLPMSAAFGVARSFALRKPMLNFVSQHSRRISITPQVQRCIAAVLSMINLALIVAGLFYSFQVKRLQEEAEGVAREVEIMRTHLRSEMVSEGLSVAVAAMRNLALEASKAEWDWLELLHSLSLSLPGDVWLTELECTRGREVIMRGTALNYRSLDEAVRSIRQMKSSDGRGQFFSDVVVTSVVSRDLGVKSVIDFRIVCTFARANMR